MHFRSSCTSPKEFPVGYLISSFSLIFSRVRLRHDGWQRRRGLTWATSRCPRGKVVRSVYPLVIYKNEQLVRSALAVHHRAGREDVGTSIGKLGRGKNLQLDAFRSTFRATEVPSLNQRNGDKIRCSSGMRHAPVQKATWEDICLLNKWPWSQMWVLLRHWNAAANKAALETNASRVRSIPYLAETDWIWLASALPSPNAAHIHDTDPRNEAKTIKGEKLS